MHSVMLVCVCGAVYAGCCCLHSVLLLAQDGGAQCTVCCCAVLCFQCELLCLQSGAAVYSVLLLPQDCGAQCTVWCCAVLCFQCELLCCHSASCHKVVPCCECKLLCVQSGAAVHSAMLCCEYIHSGYVRLCVQYGAACTGFGGSNAVLFCAWVCLPTFTGLVVDTVLFVWLLRRQCF